MFGDEKHLSELRQIAEEMILSYFENFFKELNQKPGFIFEGIKSVFKEFTVEIDYANRSNATGECKYRESKLVFYESFFHQTRLEQLSTIIHEYAHAISYKLGHGFEYSILEEGMADVLTELIINYVIRENKIDEKTKKDENLTYYLSPENKGYLPCREMVKTFLAMLHSKNADLEGIKYYFLIAKHGFTILFDDITSLKLENLNSFFSCYVAMECAEEQTKYVEIISGLIFEHFGEFLDEIDLDYLIDMCSNRHNDYSSTYFYHNLILEKHIFNRLLKIYMPNKEDITIENFLEMAKKGKGILKGHRFKSKELDEILFVLYEKDAIGFKQILSSVSYLPDELATKILNNNLKHSNDYFKTTVKLFKSIDFNLQESKQYLSYYAPNRNKRDKFIFLSRLLHSEEIDSCYYFSELLFNYDFESLSEKDNSLILKCLDNFLRHNAKLTNDFLCFKVFKMIELYLEKIKSKFINDPLYVRVKNMHKIVKSRYLKEKEVIINSGLSIKYDDLYELDIDYSNFSNYELILNLIQSPDIVLYKKYFINVLYQMILLMPDELKEVTLTKIEGLNNKDLNEILLIIKDNLKTKKQYS